MNDTVKATIAFAGSTVVSTRKDGAVEGAIVRRRKATDGTRFTTYEIDEGMAEKLFDIPGGLKRRNTAINPDSVAEAVRLYNSGTDRKDAEKALGVSSSTYRRLLEAAGVSTRKYVPVLTEENVEKALKASVKYNITKRGDIIKASKEVGVDSRILRRLLQKGLTTLTPERINEIRSQEQARLATDAGQLELILSKQPVPRKPKPTPVPLVDTSGAPKVGDMHDGNLVTDQPHDAPSETPGHALATDLAAETPHVVVEGTQPDGTPTIVEQAPPVDNVGTSLHDAPHPEVDAEAARVAHLPPVDPLDQPPQMVPPTVPVDQVDRTVPNIVPGGSHVEPIGGVPDVEELKVKGLDNPQVG